jgi:DNA replication and repair protein RecF
VYIDSLTLANFRIYSDERAFDLSPDMTMIIGANAKGKTSLLEACYMVCRGKGFREREEYELMNFGAISGNIIADMIDSHRIKHNRAILFKMGTSTSDDRHMLEKKYFLDKAPVGQIRYQRANPQVVLFAPHHIDIIVHGPSQRREYLNSVISAKDVEYARAIRAFGETMRRRNALLENYLDVQTLREDLHHWDELFLQYSEIIQKTREKYISYLHRQNTFAGKNFRIIYKKNNTSRSRLESVFFKEVASRRTLIGPQKDDFEIQIEKAKNDFISVHAYASRSQQRLAVLWLKTREIDFKSQPWGIDGGGEIDRPILLLDDIYSEFDAQYRATITNIIPNYQTILTTTDEEVVPRGISRGAKIVRL